MGWSTWSSSGRRTSCDGCWSSSREWRINNKRCPSCAAIRMPGFVHFGLRCFGSGLRLFLVAGVRLDILVGVLFSEQFSHLFLRGFLHDRRKRESAASGTEIHGDVAFGVTGVFFRGRGRFSFWGCVVVEQIRRGLIDVGGFLCSCAV